MPLLKPPNPAPNYANPNSWLFAARSGQTPPLNECNLPELATADAVTASVNDDLRDLNHRSDIGVILLSGHDIAS